MIVLAGQEKAVAEKYIQAAVLVALQASCTQSRCGSIIVKDGQIVGRGFNSPPAGNEAARRCGLQDTVSERFKSDRTCCVHAEQRAIMDALKNHPEKVGGSRLYFIRLDTEGNPKRAGEPYCTICSKMALDVGIAEFVLYREEGICVWNTLEYNAKSYEY